MFVSRLTHIVLGLGWRRTFPALALAHAPCPAILTGTLTQYHAAAAAAAAVLHVCLIVVILFCQERIKNFQEKRTAAEGSRRAKTAAKRSAQTAIKRENKRKGVKARKKGRESAIAAVAAKAGANGSAEGGGWEQGVPYLRMCGDAAREGRRVSSGTALLCFFFCWSGEGSPRCFCFTCAPASFVGAITKVCCA